MPAAPAQLTATVLEIERHAAGEGWDQQPRLFALVETAELLRREPGLAGELGGVLPGPPGALTPIEQEQLPQFAGLEEFLGGIAWPAEVLGAAMVVERMFLPPEVEEELPAGLGQQDPATLEWLAAHPQRQEVRVAAGVLRDGSRECAVRLRSHDEDDAVLTGPDLVPGLTDALAATLAD